MLGTEGLLGTLVLGHSLLWFLGGRGWIIGKAWRRYLAPALTFWVLLSLGLIWLRVVVASLSEVVVNSLAYGNSSPAWKKVVTFALIGLPAPILNAALWWAPLYTLTLFGLHYLASRRWNWFSFFQTELVAGLAQGSVLAFAFLHP